MTTPVIGAIMNFLIFKVFFRKKANWQLIASTRIVGNSISKKTIREKVSVMK